MGSISSSSRGETTHRPRSLHNFSFFLFLFLCFVPGQIAPPVSKEISSDCVAVSIKEKKKKKQTNKHHHHHHHHHHHYPFPSWRAVIDRLIDWDEENQKRHLLHTNSISRSLSILCHLPPKSTPKSRVPAYTHLAKITQGEWKHKRSALLPVVVDSYFVVACCWSYP